MYVSVEFGKIQSEQGTISPGCFRDRSKNEVRTVHALVVTCEKPFPAVLVIHTDKHIYRMLITIIRWYVHFIYVQLYNLQQTSDRVWKRAHTHTSTHTCSNSHWELEQVKEHANVCVCVYMCV